jgi:hypothetical protein
MVNSAGQPGHGRTASLRRQPALAAYDEYLGLLPRPHKDRNAGPDAGDSRREHRAAF